MKRILFLLLLLWSSFVKAQSCETFDTVRTNASSLITYNSARINGSISHIAPGQIVTIILKYVRTGQTDTASSSGTSTLRNLTGLQASTEYNYYYSTVCPSSTVSQTAGAYTFTTLANTVNYTPMAAMGYQFKYLKADSGLMAPRRDTTIGRAPDYGGQIVWKPDDSTFYGYNGEYWHALAIDSAGIITLLNDKVDSVTVAGDSLWYWKQGVSYGYILPTQSNEWDLTGNSGTTAGTNFVGTTDNVDLVLKSNAIERMRWNTSGALGLGSGTDYGTSGYVLTSQGNAAAPVWAAATGVTTMAAIGSSPNANGATISGSTLNLEPASTSFGGVVNTSTQGFTGFKYFPNNIGLGTASASTGSTHLITGTLSSTGFVRINLSNTNSGNGSGVGAIYTNDNSKYLQYYMGSSTNSYISDGAYIHTNGTGGYRFVNSGVGSKVRWSTLDAVGINNGAYLGWDADEFYHIAIPQAASTSAKTVLLYDTASGGYFSQISLDSIGSGGSGANTALSNLASVAINESLISDANNTDDLGSASLAWRNAYLGEGGAINWDNGDATLTQAGNMVTLAGADLTVPNLTVSGLTSGRIPYVSTAGLITDNAGLTFNGSTSIPALELRGTSVSDIKFIGNAGSSSIIRSSFSTYGLNFFQPGWGTATMTHLQATNNVGIQNATPTAKLHIAAGAATASYAPLKLTTGTSLTTAEAGAFEYTTPQLFFTNGAAVRQELFQGQQSRVSTQFDKTTDVTLANITGLTANVAAGKTYRFEAKLYTTSNVAGGVQFAIAGTATATAIIYEGLTTDAGLTTQGRSAALAGAVGAVTAVTAAYTTITGTITVNAAGTITCQFAQNASNGAASSVLVGSTFEIIEML